MKSLRPERLVSYSNTWQTTSMVMLMVFLAVNLTLWFFWRSLYLPELKNHANYIANQLLMLDELQDKPEIKQWVIKTSHIDILTDKNKFPVVEEKPLVGFFTNIMEEQISTVLNRPTIVYFKFKPMPILYIQDSKHSEYWLQEPVKFYAQYSPTTIGFFLFGIPIFTLLTIIILVRQLNRPLKRLQKTALDYITLGHANHLPTNEGSTEIRQVNLAFNRLFQNLTQTQKERTIMLAGISHDLRTPLTRMRLTAEMLPDEFLKEGLVYDIEDMDAILEQFISFMKDGSDEAVRLTDLAPIIHEIVVQFAPLAFDVKIDKDLPNIALRPLSIKRLIVNLVNNASRYGEPPIFITVTIIDDKAFHDYLQLANRNVTQTSEQTLFTMQRYLQISVSDKGEGVADDQLERIMQPFERGETARTTQGSGLGLAIVSRIAHLHNGMVIAHNQPDMGLVVTVMIPLVE